MSKAKFGPPDHMEFGSLGPVVNNVLGFLAVWASKNDLGPTGIICDGNYGNKGVEWMKKFQQRNGIADDGGCGPETRERMKRHGFDFVAQAKKGSEDITCFVQPDGTALYWAPHIMASTNKNEAGSRIYRVHHGN